MSYDFENMKENYLQTPERFRNIVESKVAEEIKKNTSEHKRISYRWRPLKVAACACACVLALGGGTYAASQYIATKWLHYSVSEEQAASFIEVEENAINTQTVAGSSKIMEELYGDDIEGIEEATLNIKEVYYDGLTLTAYAEPTDFGKDYNLFNRERIVIEDKVFSAGFEQLYDGNYMMKAELEGFDLPDTFVAELPVDLYNKMDQCVGRQHVIFDVKMDENIIFKSSDQVQISDKISGQINSLEITGTAAYIDVTWAFDETYMETFKSGSTEMYEYIGFKIDDGKGMVYDSLTDGTYTQSIAIYADGTQVWNNKQTEFKEENGKYYFSSQCIISNFNYDVDELTITPYYVNYEQDIQDDMEYAKFTAQLK